MSITLAQLRTQARQRADMETSNYVSDSELTTYINASIAELHDILVQAYGSDYYVSQHTFTTVAGTESYALPADLYKIMGVDLKLNGDDYITITRFNFNERNRFNTVLWNLSGAPAIRYRLLSNNIHFTPIPDNATQCKIWYIPVATKLVSDSDTFNDLNQYAEYVVVDAAIKMLAKEESDPSVLLAQKQALVKRITEAANNRDAGAPGSISDIYSENDDYYVRMS